MEHARTDTIPTIHAHGLSRRPKASSLRYRSIKYIVIRITGRWGTLRRPSHKPRCHRHPPPRKRHRHLHIRLRERTEEVTFHDGDRDPIAVGDAGSGDGADAVGGGEDADEV